MSEASQTLFTCLSCSIAFLSAEEQREHYRSDHHRYNMKRRVAGLPPVSVTIFNQKVLERRQETAVMSSTRGASCDVCGKTYTTENAYRSHLNSKKHKENEIKGLKGPRLAEAPTGKAESPAQTNGGSDETMTQPTSTQEAPLLDGKLASLNISGPSTSAPSEPTSTSAAPAPSAPVTHASEAKSKVRFATEDDENEEESDNETQSLEAKIAAARSRLSPNLCLFCPAESPSLPENLTHMASAHSFFIPDADYLVDLPGLINYLGEKIAVGNVCIFCNGKGREFRTLDAVRKHMVDKSHCKIAYDNGDDKLEISDYYDFSSSYPDAQLRKEKKEERRKRREEREKRKLEKKAAKAEDAADTEEIIEDEDEGQWEDADDVDENDVDEIVDVSASEDDSDISSDEGDHESIPDNQLTYGDSSYELVLPSGTRIGHRSMRRYYAQHFPTASRNAKPEDPNSGAALVRRLVADKNSALVPRRGGFGAYGAGTDVVKARNKGEAKEAGRHVKEYRDVRRRQEFMTKVGYVHNYQKHYRDPLLQ